MMFLPSVIERAQAVRFLCLLFFPVLAIALGSSAIIVTPVAAQDCTLVDPEKPHIAALLRRT